MHGTNTPCCQYFQIRDFMNKICQAKNKLHSVNSFELFMLKDLQAPPNNNNKNLMKYIKVERENSHKSVSFCGIIDLYFSCGLVSKKIAI